jgi:SnoaL-like domain
MIDHRLRAACVALALATSVVAVAQPDGARLPEVPAALRARSPSNLDPYTTAQLPVLVVRRPASALPAADTLAIHELISRIYLAEDSLDREALRDAVTSDFILEDSLSGRTIGRDAFAELEVKSAASRAGSRRMALNLVVSPDGEARALAVHYVLSIKAFSSATKSPDLQLLAQGIVRDQLVKDRAGWHLVRRISDQASINPSQNFNVNQRIQAARVITPNERM